MTAPSPSVSVIVPALNEAATIGEVVARIRAVGHDYEVIVVDDGSTDGTADRAREAGARVVRHVYNLGNGASIVSGAQQARGDVVVMIDADGQHPPEQIPALVEHIGPFDMVVGARTAKSKTSPLRDFGNLLLNLLARWIARHPIEDLTSGFRAIKRTHLLEYVHLFPTRYSYPTTITMAMIQGRHFVKYVPMDAIVRRSHGASGIRPVRDFLRFINIMMRLVVMFSPQRFFIPVAVLALLCGLGMSLYQLATFGGIFGSSLLMLMSAVYFFCFGLLAEQLAALRRQRTGRLQPRAEAAEPSETGAAEDDPDRC